MNFFNFIKKGTNKQLESLKDSAIYDIAAEKLEPKSYAQLAKPLYLLSQYFSVAYHLISFVVAIIGIIIFALQLDSILQKTILIVLSFLLLAIVEIAKSNASNTVFSSVARKENPNKLFLIVLLVTTVFSFVTSVWSAKESIYFASTNSKFSNLDTLQNSQIDSINNLFATQISSIETSLKASQNTLQTTKNKWLRIATNKDIQDSQNSLTNVLERKEKALQSITSNTESSKGKTDQKGKEIAIFAAVLFAIFELLNLVCYWFVYQYYQSCLLENNLPNEPNEQSQTDTVTAAVNRALQNLHLSFPNPTQTHDVTATVTANVKPSFTAVQNEPKKIGFQFGNGSQKTAHVTQNEPKTEQKTELSKGNKICQYDGCKKAYTYKVHNQKFCSEKCRINNWNQKTGKKFIKGKGGANA